MKLGVVAGNIRAGGGLTHLSELLQKWEPHQFGIDSCSVYGTKQLGDLGVGRAALHSIPDAGWFGPLKRLIPLVTDKPDCDVILVPGGVYVGSSRKVVAISQNMLLFDDVERHRYQGSKYWRLELLRRLQTSTIRRAAGTIFLTDYARDVVTSRIGSVSGCTSVIPHGIDDRFRRRPVKQVQFDSSRPMRLLYVSTVSPYKHHASVIQAVVAARAQGLSITLTLVGAGETAQLSQLKTLLEVDDRATYISYIGPIEYSKIHAVYHLADAFVFASSCENLPIILLEAMAAGLPIASATKRPMTDILGDAGAYFNPEVPAEIANALTTIYRSPEMRQSMAERAFERARPLTWARCAQQTFSFISECIDAAR